MILRYMDAKFLPGYAAVSRGKVFGYSFFVYENNKGVIGDLFVRDGFSNRDWRRSYERYRANLGRGTLGGQRVRLFS